MMNMNMMMQQQQQQKEEVLRETEMEVRRGPWTVEEDMTLMDYIAHHGEGRWNSLAHSAGLNRTGKSCRLRWLNYLRPDVRRGNITLEEQLLILELHSRWGNRWSKIAQHLPGRTDNEIKNYWRTRVQKHAKQLKCDVNSKQFKDTIRYLWMPRLLERIQAASATGPPPPSTSCTRGASSDSDLSSDCYNNHQQQQDYYAPLIVNDDHQSLMEQSLTSPTANYFNQEAIDFSWIDAHQLPDASISISDALWTVDEDDMWFLRQ